MDLPLSSTPIDSAAPAKAEGAGHADSPAAAFLPVLLVEDDPLVLMATADTLSSLGLAVAEAATGSEAKERLRATKALSSPAFGAAIVDIGLPDLAGTDLVGELRSLCPGLPVIVASGYDREMLQTHFGDDPTVHYLQKPYTVSALEALLQRLGLLPS